MARKMPNDFDFPPRVVYMGHVCELTGMEGGRAVYTSIYSGTYTFSISSSLFGYYESVGLIERGV